MGKRKYSFLAWDIVAVLVLQFIAAIAGLILKVKTVHSCKVSGTIVPVPQ